MRFFRPFFSAPHRPAVKKLSDISLSADDYSPDFEIAERYTSFSGEIITLSLLGIGGFGFIIANIIMKVPETGNGFSTVLSAFHSTIWILIAGTLFLTLALAFGLYHRFSSANCLYDQILILRSLRRLENVHWTDKEKEEEKKFLQIARQQQRREARLYHNILMWSGIFLFTGFAFMAAEFLIILIHIGNY